MKEALSTHPILWYPDPDRPYVLFTDASKYRWEGVLAQPYEEIHESNQLTANTDVIGTVYPNIPLSSASLHGHPRSSLGATLGVRMSATAYEEPLNRVQCMANRRLQA